MYPLKALCGLWSIREFQDILSSLLSVSEDPDLDKHQLPLEKTLYCFFKTYLPSRKALQLLAETLILFFLRPWISPCSALKIGVLLHSILCPSQIPVFTNDLTMWLKSLRLKGLLRKPSNISNWSSSGKPVIAIKGVADLSEFLIYLATSFPSIFGIRISLITRSKSPISSNNLIPFSPSSATSPSVRFFLSCRISRSLKSARPHRIQGSFWLSQEWTPLDQRIGSWNSRNDCRCYRRWWPWWRT